MSCRLRLTPDDAEELSMRDCDSNSLRNSVTAGAVTAVCTAGGGQVRARLIDLPIDRGISIVGVALLLAEIQVQPAAELAAEEMPFMTISGK